MRAAIYLRVSTKDGRQDTMNQRLQLEKYIADRGWEVVFVYEDLKSGKSDDRPAFQKMFMDAQRRTFDVLVFWALDRFSREGILGTFRHIERLNGLGIKFFSFSEPFLETADTMVGGILLSVWAAMAKQERLKISERTVAGLERKRKEFAAGKGKPGPKGYYVGGRPRVAFDFKTAQRLLDEKKSYRQIAAVLGLSHTTVQKRLEERKSA